MKFTNSRINNYIDEIEYRGNYPIHSLHMILNLDPIHLSWMESDKHFTLLTPDYILDGLITAIHGIGCKAVIQVDYDNRKRLVIKCNSPEHMVNIKYCNVVYSRAIWCMLLKIRLFEMMGRFG